MNRKTIIVIVSAIAFALIAKFANNEVETVGLILSLAVGAGIGVIISGMIFKED